MVIWHRTLWIDEHKAQKILTCKFSKQPQKTKHLFGFLIIRGTKSEYKMNKSILLLSALSASLFSCNLVMADNPCGPPLAEDVMAFTKPQDSDWGGWSRGSTGSVYAGWDVFESSPDPVFSNDSTPDGYVTYVMSENDPNAQPEFTQYGVAPSPVYVGFPDAQIIAGPGLGIFKTSTNNWYSFSATPAYNVLLLANQDHQDSSGPVTVAFQIASMGQDIDDTSVELVDMGPYDSKTTLIDCSTEAHGSTTSYREYLYLWTIQSPQDTYQIAFSAQGSSMSLDALAIDVGTEQSPQIEENVPALPIWGLSILALLLFSYSKKRKSFKSHLKVI